MARAARHLRGGPRAATLGPDVPGGSSTRRPHLAGRPGSAGVKAARLHRTSTSILARSDRHEAGSRIFSSRSSIARTRVLMEPAVRRRVGSPSSAAGAMGADPHTRCQSPSWSAIVLCVNATRTSPPRARFDRRLPRTEQRLEMPRMTPPLGLKHQQPDRCTRPSMVRSKDMLDRSGSFGQFFSIIRRATWRMPGPWPRRSENLRSWQVMN